MYGVEFRPLVFKDVYGLPVVKRVLQNAINQESYDRGYLFHGPHSTGKTSMGRLFARSVLCSNRAEDMSPCNECSSCRAFLQNRHPSYTEIDAANNGTKDRVQDVKKALKYESMVGRKFILFDEAHNMSKEAIDALLAHLEANEDTNTTLLFCTTEKEKISDTLGSRCMDFQFSKPGEKDIVRKLSGICEIKNLEYDPEALELIVRATGRHYRDAENRLRQVELFGGVTVDNVKAVTSQYDNEIAEMLSALPTDLGRALSLSEYIISRMNVTSVYNTILRLINDAVKLENGVQFQSEHYRTLLSRLNTQFGSVLFELLDYILGKNRLNDVTVFQSDLLVIHYKFAKGGLKFRGFSASGGAGKEERPKTEIRSAEKDRKVNEDSIRIAEAKHLEPWKREDLLRDYKRKKTLEGSSEKVTERVSEVWGPEIKDKVHPNPVRKTKLSPKEFCEAIGDASEETV